MFILLCCSYAHLYHCTSKRSESSTTIVLSRFFIPLLPGLSDRIIMYKVNRRTTTVVAMKLFPSNQDWFPPRSSHGCTRSFKLFLLLLSALLSTHLSSSSFPSTSSSCLFSDDDMVVCEPGKEKRTLCVCKCLTFFYQTIKGKISKETFILSKQVYERNMASPHGQAKFFRV